MPTMSPEPASEPALRFNNLTPGDPAPWFVQRSGTNPRFALDTVAGRYILLCFYGTTKDPRGAAALQAVKTRRAIFDDQRLAFFGISLDPEDESSGRVADALPGIRYFWDFDGAVSRGYGAIPRQAEAGAANVPVRRFWLVLDPTLRVMRIFPFQDDSSEHGRLFTFLASLPPVSRFSGIDLQAPLLFLPQVFEPAFCQRLIDLYEAHGGQESGFMREVDGKTTTIMDPSQKRRRDHVIEDQQLIAETQTRIRRRVAPEIAKAHQFHVTRMERYIVACYDAADEAHFRAHRDNTTKGTAHRRFAVSINLNGDFQGGEVNFPEYGPRSYKPPPGGAVVFSCSLLHAVSKVTAGKRYAFLPFLYDDAAAKLREQNNAYLAEGVGDYAAAAKPG
jgi:peroxiredoxin/predicted 2-oxoglutarate/Fe(II)-dependent dioxygenase YbiX